MTPAEGVRRRPLAALTLAVVLLGTAASGCGGGSGPSATPTSEASYGGLPSFLPSAAANPDGELAGSSSEPALTSQGLSVKVTLPLGSVRMTVTGPEVPGGGFPHPPESTTCTWTVTVRDATASLPLQVSQFTTIDHLGKVYHPLLVPGQPAPPATLAPGATATFELRTVMRIGQGLMRWAPEGTILASWDFAVETD